MKEEDNDIVVIVEGKYHTYFRKGRSMIIKPPKVQGLYFFLKIIDSL